MSNHEDRRPASACRIAQQIPDLPRSYSIHSTGGFVGKDDLLGTLIERPVRRLGEVHFVNLPDVRVKDDMAQCSKREVRRFQSASCKGPLGQIPSSSKR